MFRNLCVPVFQLKLSEWLINTPKPVILIQKSHVGSWVRFLLECHILVRESLSVLLSMVGYHFSPYPWRPWTLWNDLFQKMIHPFTKEYIWIYMTLCQNFQTYILNHFGRQVSCPLGPCRHYSVKFYENSQKSSIQPWAGHRLSLAFKTWHWFKVIITLHCVMEKVCVLHEDHLKTNEMSIAWIHIYTESDSYLPMKNVC